MMTPNFRKQAGTLLAITTLLIALSNSAFAQAEVENPVQETTEEFELNPAQKAARGVGGAITKLNFGVAVGLGRQYAGLFGAQASLGYGPVRFNLSYGLISLGAGMDLKLTHHFSAGIFAFGAFFASGVGLHLSYNFNSTFSRGFILGVNVADVRSSFSGIDEIRDTEIFLALGYKFF